MLSGVYVANVSPFREDTAFTLDEEAYLEHVRWLGDNGVQGVVPFGTNGEGPSTTLREKLQVLEALFDVQLPLEVIPTVAQGNVPETLEMLKALNEFPAEAVMVLPPYYFKPVTVEGLLRFYGSMFEATRHRVILYHIPKYAPPIPVEVVKALPAWGVKDSGGEPGYAEGLIAAGKGVFIGSEDDLWQRLNCGASGMVSALANFIPEQIVEVYESVKFQDETGGKALSEKLQRIRSMTKEYNSISLLKKLAEARHGVYLGTVRPPLTPAPQDYDTQHVLRAAGVM